MNEQPPTRFKIGDRIRVIDGTFKGLAGIIDQIDEAAGVLCAMVQVPGRHGPVPIEFLIPQIALDDRSGPPA